MVERRTPNPDAGGSSPSWPAKFFSEFNGIRNLLNAKSKLFGDSIVNKDTIMAASAKSKKSNVAKSKEPSPFSPAQIKQFIEEVKVEFLKIVWPDKKMTLGLTGVVVALTVVISIYLGSVDMVLGKIVASFLR